MAPCFTTPLTVVCTVLIATVLSPLMVHAIKTHDWGCCSTKQNPFRVQASEEIHFNIVGEGDVWELQNQAAFDSCNFSGAIQHSADPSKPNLISVKGSGSQGMRYFASKVGMNGNACNVDEWPLKVAVIVDAPEVETKGLSTPKTYTNKFKPFKNWACQGSGGKFMKSKKPVLCKKFCLKTKGCTAYDFSRKRPLKKRCIVYTDPAVQKGKKTPKTFCYVRQSKAVQAS